MHGYASLSRRLTAIKVVFALVTVVALAAIVSDLLELTMMNRALAGNGLSGAEFDANERRQNVVGGVQFVLFIVAAVTFLTWLTRAYTNLDAIGPNERRFGHGWLVGAWFVPIFNLWRPKQYVDDVSRAGRPHASMLLPEPEAQLLCPRRVASGRAETDPRAQRDGGTVLPLIHRPGQGPDTPGDLLGLSRPRDADGVRQDADQLPWW